MKILTEEQFKKEYDYYVCDQKTGDQVLDEQYIDGRVFIARWNTDAQYMHYFVRKNKTFYVCETLNWFSVNHDDKLVRLLEAGVDPLTALEICDL